MLDTEHLTIIGDAGSKNVFIQLVDEHDLKLMEEEAQEIKKESANTDWCIAAVFVKDWNFDLAPWKAKAIFGNQDFGDGAEQTLKTLLEQIIPAFEQEHPVSEGKRQYYLCGYSLAGLFALWAAYQTDFFCGVVAASPSVWYPDWISYVKDRPIHTAKIYLSLGEKEEKAKNKTLASVGDAIRKQHQILADAGKDTRLDWNSGNHFVDSEKRVAKGIAWLL